VANGDWSSAPYRVYYRQTNGEEEDRTDQPQKKATTLALTKDHVAELEELPVAR
jgi:hypothetical protein